MPLTLELLGGFHLCDAEGRTIRVPDRRARGLIAYLALAEHATPRQALGELLCPEGDEQDQRTALRQAVYVARKATAEHDLFVSAGDQLRLDERLLVSDVRRFQSAIARADRDGLSAAVELYRGPLLAGERSPSAAFEDWLAGSRGELLEQVTRALLALAERHEAASEHDPALALGRRALTLDPLREDARRQVMRSLAALGQRAAALREYELGQELLADELQVAPDDETARLRGAISSGDQALAKGRRAPATSDPHAVAGGATPRDRADRGAPPSAVGRMIDLRRAGTPRRSAAAFAAILLAAGFAAWWHFARQPPAGSPAGAAVAEAALPLPDKPSIAVLPFDNLSGEQRFERLADGIADDIIADLSRFRELFVIARNSTFVYKDKPTDVRAIGRELGVQYILEGSLKADQDRVRITAQLIDAASGNHAWSERYDRPLDDVFAIQGEVTQSIAAQLAGFHGVVVRATRETARRKPPARLEAFDLYALGLEHKHLFTKEGVANAQRLFEQALAIDPNYARAYYGLAQTYGIEADYGWRDWHEAMDDWGSTIRKAISLDPYDSGAHSEFAFYYQRLGSSANSLAELDEALRLNPSDADVLATAGFILPKLGQPERGLELVQRAVRLNPHFPDWYNAALRDAHFHNRQFEETVAILDRKQNRSPVMDPLVQAMSYAQLGRASEAKASAAQLFRDQPDWSAERHISGSGNYARDIELNLFLDSVRKAGLPLCATKEQLATYPEIERLAECEDSRPGR